MTRILILKTGALGDVLRTTSILPGLGERYPGCRIAWVTAYGARDLVARHPRIHAVHTVDPKDADSVAEATARLAAEGPWDRVLSFDDEEPLCRAASELGGGRAGVVSGAYLDEEGVRRYTPDVAPWFDMGLLSVHGKEEADRRKIANTRTHPEIFASMLGIEAGEPELPLPDDALAFGRAFAARTGIDGRRPVVGLNTGAGGRWASKRLAVERTVGVVGEIHRALGGRPSFVVLGGPDEAERNARILAGCADLAGAPHVVDAGTGNSLPQFGGIVDGLDLLLTSDSLAMHVAIARRVPVVAFFAPTSAAEIELYGRGEKVASTAPDACTYRADVDTSTLTVERVAGACLRVLGVRGGCER